MDRPKIIPADPVAAAEMAEQEANTETTPRDVRKPYPENPGLTDKSLAEQNERTGRASPPRADIERSNAAEQRGRTA
ncbi:MAG: hypothetical protein EON57_02430 [Alphaproteobacteria bacterium]|nr:MAG: hypothetical protein EON57_02430 [Alphaproteobacteria bacterium]